MSQLRLAIQASLLDWEATVRKSHNSCGKCQKSFESVEELAQHVQLQHSEPTVIIITCGLCNVAFKNKNLLQKHLKTHTHATCEWECKQCGVEFGNKAIFMRHQAWHAASEPQSTCKACGKCFMTKIQLDMHTCSHITKSKLVYPICHICRRMFRNENILADHMQRHSVSSKTFHCLYCHKSFSTKGSVYVHTRQHHNTNSSKNTWKYKRQKQLRQQKKSSKVPREEQRELVQSNTRCISLVHCKPVGMGKRNSRQRQSKVFNVANSNLVKVKKTKQWENEAKTFVSNLQRMFLRSKQRNKATQKRIKNKEQDNAQIKSAASQIEESNSKELSTCSLSRRADSRLGFICQKAHLEKRPAKITGTANSAAKATATNSEVKKLALDYVKRKIIVWHDHPYAAVQGKQFYCTVCFEKFSYYKQLMAHEKTYSLNHTRPLFCKENTASPSKKKRVQRHNLASCPGCSLVFLDEISLIHHLNSSALCRVADTETSMARMDKPQNQSSNGKSKPNKECLTICHKCKAVFATPAMLILHEAVHNCNDLNTSEKKYTFRVKQIYECNICSVMVTNIRDLTAHIKMHNKDASLSCDLCSITVSSKSALKEHRETYHPEELIKEIVIAPRDCKSDDDDDDVNIINRTCIEQCEMGTPVLKENCHDNSTLRTIYPFETDNMDVHIADGIVGAFSPEKALACKTENAVGIISDYKSSMPLLEERAIESLMYGLEKSSHQNEELYQEQTENTTLESHTGNQLHEHIEIMPFDSGSTFSQPNLVCVKSELGNQENLACVLENSHDVSSSHLLSEESKCMPHVLDIDGDNDKYKKSLEEHYTGLANLKIESCTDSDRDTDNNIYDALNMLQSPSHASFPKDHADMHLSSTILIEQKETFVSSYSSVEDPHHDGKDVLTADEHSSISGTKRADIEYGLDSRYTHSPSSAITHMDQNVETDVNINSDPNEQAFLDTNVQVCYSSRSCLVLSENEKLSHQNALMYEMNKPEEETVFTCGLCAEQFDTVKGLCDHVTSHIDDKYCAGCNQKKTPRTAPTAVNEGTYPHVSQHICCMCDKDVLLRESLLTICNRCVSNNILKPCTQDDETSPQVKILKTSDSLIRSESCESLDMTVPEITDHTTLLHSQKASVTQQSVSPHMEVDEVLTTSLLKNQQELLLVSKYKGQGMLMQVSGQGSELITQLFEISTDIADSQLLMSPRESKLQNSPKKTVLRKVKTTLNLTRHKDTSSLLSMPLSKNTLETLSSTVSVDSAHIDEEEEPTEDHRAWLSGTSCAQPHTRTKTDKDIFPTLYASTESLQIAQVNDDILLLTKNHEDAIKKRKLSFQADNDKTSVEVSLSKGPILLPDNVCKHCDKACRSLELHRCGKATPRMPYICSVCCRGFLFQAKMKRHMYSHAIINKMFSKS